jgi:V-type H+-transporting ATPase subunit a
MIHKKIRMPRATAVQIMDELGKSEDAIEFVDLNKDNLDSKKNFSEIVARCDEMEKLFIKFEKICLDHDMEIKRYENYKKFSKDLMEDEGIRNKRGGSTYFDMLESEINNDEKEIEELIDSYEKIKENIDYLYEKRAVIEKTSQLFNQSANGQLIRTSSFQDENVRMMEQGFVSDLNYLAGVAKAEDELRMKRMIFRVSKGRAIPHFFNFPEDNKNINKKEKVEINFYYKKNLNIKSNFL